MRKLWLLAIGVMIIFSLNACNSDNDNSTSSEESSTSTSNWSIGTPISPMANTAQLPVIDENAVVYPSTAITDSLLYTLQTSNGATVQYFGEKDENGGHLSLKEVCIETASKQSIIIVLDNENRPTRISRGDGKILEFDWNSQTIIEVNGSIPCSKNTNTLTTTKFEPTLKKIFTTTELTSLADTQDSPAQQACQEEYDKSKETFNKACQAVSGILALADLAPIAGILALLCVYSDEILDATRGRAWDKHCEEKYMACDANASFSGGVGTQAYHFEMGINSGTFIFSYEFYTVPDQIHILHDGKVIYKTSCSGGNGGQSMMIPFSGQSTAISVEVWGDCTGKGSTGWDFNISCPF